MAVAAEIRKKLESATFPDLETMMEGYARAAAEVAQSQFRRTLDFSAESVDRLDEIVAMVGDSPEVDLEFEVRLWGSYLGELLRRRYAGSWEMTVYPGSLPDSRERSPVAVPAVEVRGSRLFPLMKVYRRLTMGEEDDLRAFYTMVTSRLGNPAQVN
ncbi:MAG TPA: hypothetical protein VKU93_00810 [Terracidiphilus sp.]|jgi:hypothetical protein|nr:hypothetical protein [Terracidiphilus sp.]